MRRALSLVATLSLALPAAATGQAVPPAGLQAVLANGYRFAYADSGAGPALLLVHGALTDYRFWSLQLADLSDSFRVIVPSRRYHYPNPWRADDPPSGFSTTAADLAAIIRALRLPAPVVMGHSWAAPALLELASRYPDLVSGLVLVNPVADSLITDPGMRSRVAAGRWQAYRDALEVYRPSAPTPAIDVLLAAWFGAGTTLASLPADSRERILANAQTLPSAAAPQPALTCGLLGQIEAPTLLVGATDAPAEELETLATLARCLQRAQRHELPDGGRTLPRARAEALDAAVRKFMHTLADTTATTPSR